MTEAEFKAAVKPIVAQYPTPELKAELAALWFEALASGIPGDRLAAIAREVLHGDPEDQSDTIN